jgi:serine/threonine protein kinase
VYSVGTHSLESFAPFELPGLDGRYEILDLLDRGGMSIVYKARDKVLDRTVAIKTIKTSRLEQKQLVSFQDEARAICSLTHEGIVRVLDFGVMKGGQPYLVLDYLAGETMARHVKNHGPLKLVDALAVMLQVCEAIGHAHEHGVIHRDLKSSNIMLAKNLSARVIDFGIAVVLDNPSRGITLTPAGSIVGSPAYMSPEQIMQRRIDARTDIYSLGCVLFEAVTGKQPFSAPSALEVMHQHLNNAPPIVPASICDADLLPGLRSILDKALQKDADKRFQSIEEFHQEILALWELAELADAAPLKIELPKRAEFLDGRAVSQKDSQIIRLDNLRAQRANLITIAFILSLMLGAATIAGTMLYSRDGLSLSLDDLYNNDRPDDHLPGAIQDDMSEFIISSADSAWKKAIRHELEYDFESLPFNTEDIDLNQTDLRKVDLESLKKLKVLKRISFFDCDLASSELRKVAAIENLQTINLGKNINLKPEDLRQLKNLKGLTKLAIDSCCLSDEHIEAISECKSLKYLRIGWNRGLTAKSVEYLTRLPNLNSIDLGGCNFKSSDLIPLAKMGKITYLKADYLNFHDSDVDQLAHFKDLDYLSLSYSNCSKDAVVRLTKQLHNLKRLRIAGSSKINETDLATIRAHFPNLAVTDEAALF